MFYIVQYQVRWTDQSALHFSSPGRPVHSDTVLGFSGKHSSHAAITREDYSITFPPLSIARYSFVLHRCMHVLLPDTPLPTTQNWDVVRDTKVECAVHTCSALIRQLQHAAIFSETTGQVAQNLQQFDSFMPARITTFLLRMFIGIAS